MTLKIPTRDKKNYLYSSNFHNSSFVQRLSPSLTVLLFKISPTAIDLQEKPAFSPELRKKKKKQSTQSVVLQTCDSAATFR